MNTFKLYCARGKETNEFDNELMGYSEKSVKEAIWDYGQDVEDYDIVLCIGQEDKS